ncbi:hypothetical protein JOF46_001275 [Paeniglutamicibacter psychrophenolicus]|uniref:Uncharacterized protein n=1 Tax=Paeniglutamicibacter psychrophenolicus TaxID=257454 RepID=A0ABS4WAZ8_9MICC|nr:hypothetical protein [Paeniglutamicibacter psychrophenolicus]
MIEQVPAGFTGYGILANVNGDSGQFVEEPSKRLTAFPVPDPALNIHLGSAKSSGPGPSV